MEVILVAESVIRDSLVGISFAYANYIDRWPLVPTHIFWTCELDTAREAVKYNPEREVLIWPGGTTAGVD